MRRVRIKECKRIVWAISSRNKNVLVQGYGNLVCGHLKVLEIHFRTILLTSVVPERRATLLESAEMNVQSKPWLGSKWTTEASSGC